MGALELEQNQTSRSLPEQSSAVPQAIALKRQEESATHCTTCNSHFKLPRSDGSIEKPSILPSPPVSGDTYIQRWIRTSTNNDCHICRRSMLYRTCMHVTKAREVVRVPKGSREKEMPEKCLRCRMEDSGNEMTGLRESREMLEAREQALIDMRIHLPGVFGGVCRGTVESVGERRGQLRRNWKGEIDDVLKEAEDKEGRPEW